MKKKLILAISSYFLMSSTALADPISIGSAIISGLMSIGAAGILPAMSAGLLGSIVLGVGAIGAQFLVGSLMGPKMPKLDPGEYKSTFDTGNSSEIRAIGRIRISGLKAFGNTEKYNRWRLICHVKGPIAAIEEHFIGGREVTVDSNGAVSSPPWSKKGGAWLYIKSKAGNGNEQSWPELMSAFPDLWTADHRVRGIAQSLIQYISPGINEDKFLKLYQGGEPSYERVQRSEFIYDPRDSSQQRDNPATWKYSDNGVLGAAHILRTYPSLKSTDLDWNVIGQEASKAETQVAAFGGNQPRCRAWGIWPSERPRGEVMDQVLRSIGAELVQTSNNKYAIKLIDDVRVPEITIRAKDIIDLQWKSGPDSVERPNVCRIKFYSQERNFEMSEIPLSKTPNLSTAVPLPWSRVQSEIDKVGEQFFDVDLPFCPSSAQAQRIGRRLFALSRADVGLVKTNMAGLATWGHTTANLELPDLDKTVAVAIGVPRVNDGDGTVEIPFVVWPDLSPWNVTRDEAPPPDKIPDMEYESELPTPIRPYDLAQVRYADNTYELRASFKGVSGGTDAEVVVRRYVDGEPELWETMTDYGSGVGNRYAYKNANFNGDKTDLRVRFFNNDDEGSYWSPYLTADPVFINNTKPAPPNITVEYESGGENSSAGYDVTVFSDNINVRSCRLLLDGVQIASGNVRPLQGIFRSLGNLSGGSHGRTYILTAYAQVSDGTESEAATRTITVSGDGGD